MDESPVSEVEQLKVKESVLKLIREQLLKAQQHMVTVANGKRRDVELEIGYKTYLKSRSFCQGSLIRPKSAKLTPRHVGPFQMDSNIGLMAYRIWC